MPQDSQLEGTGWPAQGVAFLSSILCSDSQRCPWDLDKTLLTGAFARTVLVVSPPHVVRKGLPAVPRDTCPIPSVSGYRFWTVCYVSCTLRPSRAHGSPSAVALLSQPMWVCRFWAPSMLGTSSQFGRSSCDDSTAC